MTDNQFKKLLELMNKGKEEKEKAETKNFSPVKLKAHLGKTFYDRWMEDRDE